MDIKRASNSLVVGVRTGYQRSMVLRSIGSWIVLASGLLLTACVGTQEGDGDREVVFACDARAEDSRTASCVSSFFPGEGSGYGMEKFPENIFGVPQGGGERDGGLDVLSLGKSGEITIGFGGNTIINGDGPDFIVFENAFYVGGDPEKPFKELGEVSVSEDGKIFVPFPCAKEAYPYTGCAGWHAVMSSSDSGVSPYDPEQAGGDAFDLADIGLSSARLVRIRDISGYGSAPNAGFDLDAVAIVNASMP